MPQVHLYLSEQKVEVLKRRARAKGMSLSKYLAELVTHDIADAWPEGYFTEVLGSWEGNLERPAQGSFETREAL